MSKALKRRSHFYRRFHASCYAWRDILRRRASYSQWAEDALIRDYLKENGGIPPGWMYVDVGANHPTVISDTYLFYKSGYNGICVEPNVELADLLARFRPRDIVIPAAVAATRGLLKFYVTDNPVFSHFRANFGGSGGVFPVGAGHYSGRSGAVFDLPGVFLLKWIPRGMTAGSWSARPGCTAYLRGSHGNEGRNRSDRSTCGFWAMDGK